MGLVVFEGCLDCVWILGVHDAFCSGELVLVPLQVANKWVLKELRCLERVRTGRVAGRRSRRGFSSSSRWNYVGVNVRLCLVPRCFILDPAALQRVSSICNSIFRF